MSNDFDNRFSRAKERQEAFVNALPKELKDAEDKIPNLLKSLNSSNQTKLTRIYNLADEFLKHRDPYVACKKRMRQLLPNEYHNINRRSK